MVRGVGDGVRERGGNCGTGGKCAVGGAGRNGGVVRACTIGRVRRTGGSTGSRP